MVTQGITTLQERESLLELIKSNICMVKIMNIWAAGHVIFCSRMHFALLKFIRFRVVLVVTTLQADQQSYAHSYHDNIPAHNKRN